MDSRRNMSRCLGLVVLISQLLISSFATSSSKISRYHLINAVNRKGPYIGLITVYPPEENAFFSTKAFKPDSDHPFVDLSGNKWLIVINIKMIPYYY